MKMNRESVHIIMRQREPNGEWNAMAELGVKGRGKTLDTRCLADVLVELGYTQIEKFADTVRASYIDQVYLFRLNSLPVFFL